MKINKFTSALVALGIISLASAAQAAIPVIYLTGSTAARTTIGNAMLATGQIFDSGTAGTIVSPAPNNSASGSLVVFEGKINGTTVDIDCSFTGSEAGIAAVAGQPLTQNVNGGTFSLPGVPPSFLVQAATGNYSTTNTLPIAGGVSTPDLSMADTSQAVSQTPQSAFPLTDYGIVGIVTFTFMKGYEATPDTAWNDLVNVTTGEVNQNLTVGDNYNADNYTGVAADAADGVAIDGRNKGSGTRANALLNLQYGINTPVTQYSYDADYPTATPGVLTFGDPATGGPNFASKQALVDVFNDGYDSGGSVGESMQVDGTGSGIVLVGYLGISDAKNANTAGHYVTGQGGAATYLPYNGVYESDAAVINGDYSFWGQEHLLGSINQSSTSQAGKVAAAIVKGIAANLTATAAGTATGNVSNNPSQSAIIPVTSMLVHREGDSGFPIQGGF